MATMVGVARDGGIIRGKTREQKQTEQEELDAKYSVAAREMTSEKIAQICKDRQMWSQPHLNTQLFLNYKGFESIAGLEDYVRVRCLHLGNNNIARIEGLERMTDLRTLYLECNRIMKIENLEYNLELRHLGLQGNAISTVSGIRHLTKLEQINVSNNAIHHIADIQEITEAPGLTNVDVSGNQIEETDGVVELWTLMSNRLRMLRFYGNPGVRHVTHYRKRLISGIPQLGYLDERPVFPAERRQSVAWSQGGREAMEQERQNMAKEKKDENAVDPERREFLTQQRKKAIARIDREARENAEALEQNLQRIKDGSKDPQGAVQAGDLEALAKYEKTWQTKVSLHGLDGVRSQVASGAAGYPGAAAGASAINLGAKRPDAAKPAAADEVRDAGDDDEKAAARKQAAAENKKKAGDAILLAQEKAAAARPDPVMSFCPPSRATGSRAQPGLPTRGTHHLAPRWPRGASDFRVGREDTASAPVDQQDAAYRENEDRQFAVMGEDVWAGSAIGSAWDPQKSKDASNGAATGARDAGDMVVPDLWQNMAASNAEAERKTMNMQMEALTEKHTPAPSAAAVQVVQNELSSLD